MFPSTSPSSPTLRPNDLEASLLHWTVFQHAQYLFGRLRDESLPRILLLLLLPAGCRRWLLPLCCRLRTWLVCMMWNARPSWLPADAKRTADACHRSPFGASEGGMSSHMITACVACAFMRVITGPGCWS